MTDEKSIGIRYFFEHRMLRDMYQDDPESFISRLFLCENELYRLYDELCRWNDLPNPYQFSQFAVRLIMPSYGTSALQLTLPEPEADTLCYRIYAFATKEGCAPTYFTIEKGYGLRTREPWICRWMKEERWIHMTSSVDERKDEFAQCMELYETVNVKEMFRYLNEVAGVMGIPPKLNTQILYLNRSA